MKRFLSFMLYAVAALAFASCEKPTPEPEPTPEPGQPSVENTDGIYVYGGATTTGFDLESMESFDEVGGLYSWEGYLIGGAPFQFPTQKTSEFPCYMVVEDEEGNLSLGYAETADDLVVWTVDIDGTYEIIIDMRDEENVEVAVELVAPDLSKMEITELYILGDATATGWNLMAMGKFETEGNGIFTWEGPLKAYASEGVAARFRFPLQQVPNTWWPCLMAGPDGKIIFGNRDADEVNTPVEQDGLYKIVIDINDRENMTYTIELIEAGLPDPEINVLYMIGTAVDTGWDLASATSFTGADGILTWEGELKANQEFRMTLSNLTDCWFPSIVLQKGTQTAVYCESQEEWDTGNYEHFKVDQDGVYKIEINVSDLEAITYTITYVGAGSAEPEPEQPSVNPDYFVQELYLLGPATSAGWDLSNMESFTYDDGIWTWEGNLAAGEFRFQTQKVDFVPALMMGAEPGTLIYVDSYEAAGAATHLSVATAGTYRIVVDGRSAESLTYTITDISEDSVNPEDFVQELYLLGPATSAGWSLAAMEAFTYKAGLWVWEGNLAAGEFRFQTQKVDFVPALMMGAEPGKLLYVDTYELAGLTPHLSVAEAGTYKIVVDGKDVNNLTYTITKL